MILYSIPVPAPSMFNYLLVAFVDSFRFQNVHTNVKLPFKSDFFNKNRFNVFNLLFNGKLLYYMTLLCLYL